MEIANAFAVIIGVSVIAELVLRYFDRRAVPPVEVDDVSEPKRESVRRDWLRLVSHKRK